MATKATTQQNETNFFGYKVVDNVNGETVTNATASFRYRGYEIVFTTFNPAGGKPLVLRNHAFISEHHSVEAAIAAVDELLNWQSMPHPAARSAALRHAGSRVR